MKRLLIVILTVMMLILGVFSVSASSPLLTDNADILTDEEESGISLTLEKVSSENDAQVVVVTTDTLSGDTPEGFIEYFYFNGDYNEDCIVLLICIPTTAGEDRIVHIGATGECSEKIDNQKIDEILDDMVPLLKSGDYDRAVDVYAEKCANYLTDKKDYTELLLIGGICLAVGFVIALITVLSMRSKHKSVRRVPDAHNYLKSGSLNIREARDIFLYFNITRVPKPKNNNKMSSGGGSFTGGGKKF